MSPNRVESLKPGAPSREPVAWSLLPIPAAAQFLLHLLTAGRYGIFRDEYYYLACAARPDWGYVDHPPLSIWILAAWKAVFGDSVASLRILPAAAGSMLIILTGVLAAEMGGRRWAQFLAGLAVAVGGASLGMGGLYAMNAFDLLFWAGAYLLVVRIARTGEGRWWPWLGLVVGLGLMNKIGLLVFGFVLAIGLVATPHRRHLADRRLWLAAALAVALIAPYVIWNAAHDWPTLEFIENAKRYKISDLSPQAFLGEITLEANPLVLPIWAGGLAWLLMARRARQLRIVALMFVLTLAVLVAQKSKPYYMAASFPLLLAAGGVAWEAWSTRIRWVRWLLALTVLAGGVVMAPFALPLLAPERLVAYQERLGIVPNTGEVGHTSALPQYFSDRFGWEEMARTVAAVYATLSPAERAECVVLTKNYGEAGALEYWSRRHDLPPVACRHNNYWLWGPPAGAGAVVIVVTSGSEPLGKIFEEVTLAAVSRTPHALESHIHVWLCRRLLYPLPEVWADLRLFI